MLRKFLLLMGITLLAACSANETEEAVNDEEDAVVEEAESTEVDEASPETAEEDNDTSEETESAEADLAEVEVETVEEEVDIAAASADKAAFGLVKDDTFTNETGQAVWEKYQEMTEEYTLKDVFIPEGSGSSSAEVEELMSDMEIEPDSMDLGNGHTLMIYHFPDDELAHENGEPFIMADMTFIFDEDDHLIHSSIAPGFYELDLSGTPNAEDLGDVISMDDLADDHDPQVFAVGEMLINEATITQALIPVDADDNTLGLYVYALGDTIVYSNGDLFFTISADFPTYSYLYFQDLVQAYSTM
ncbi:hypothetical protein [Salinicoccus kekensis]|uniref:Lipoprotein n=1 Tax=Salinicoccus kekensis TaxID=714307 RepID=A0A285UFM2_9STAP|nr:hypothetical protein [Salinicoccus kekensis]SOC40612.1 hypothetical protein SAMN05878391_1026 [Salinicoccus kekensis]